MMRPPIGRDLRPGIRHATVQKLVDDDVVDGFERGNIDPYDGDTAAFETQQATAKEGDYALEGSGGQNHIRSNDLDNLPEPGDTFRCWVRIQDEGGTDNVFIGWATRGLSGYYTPEGYHILLSADRDDVRIRKVDSEGNTNDLDTVGNAGLAHGTWYDVEVEWGTDGMINATVFDEDDNEVASLSATDSDYSSGGISFAANQGSGGEVTAFWDDYRIMP